MLNLTAALMFPIGIVLFADAVADMTERTPEAERLLTALRRIGRFVTALFGRVVAVGRALGGLLWAGVTGLVSGCSRIRR